MSLTVAMQSVVTALNKLSTKGDNISLEVYDMFKSRLEYKAFEELVSNRRSNRAVKEILEDFTDPELHVISHKITTYTRLHRYLEYTWRPGRVRGKGYLEKLFFDKHRVITKSLYDHLENSLVAMYHWHIMTIIGVAEERRPNTYKRPIFYLFIRSMPICFRSTVMCPSWINTALQEVISVQSIKIYPIKVHDVDVAIRCFNNFLSGNNCATNVVSTPKLVKKVKVDGDIIDLRGVQDVADYVEKLFGDDSVAARTTVLSFPDHKFTSYSGSNLVLDMIGKPFPFTATLMTKSAGVKSFLKKIAASGCVELPVSEVFNAMGEAVLPARFTGTS